MTWGYQNPAQQLDVDVKPGSQVFDPFHSHEPSRVNRCRTNSFADVLLLHERLAKQWWWCWMWEAQRRVMAKWTWAYGFMMDSKGDDTHTLQNVSCWRMELWRWLGIHHFRKPASWTLDLFSILSQDVDVKRYQGVLCFWSYCRVKKWCFTKPFGLWDAKSYGKKTNNDSMDQWVCCIIKDPMFIHFLEETLW